MAQSDERVVVFQTKRSYSCFLQLQQERREEECSCPDCTCTLSLLCPWSCCRACVTESYSTMELFSIVGLLEHRVLIRTQ